MSGGVKLRRVIGWIAVMLLIAVMALGHVWKQNTHARLSRELVKTARERDLLAAEVMLLDTETRGLRHYSRLETVARERLGLINPGPPVVIQPAGQVMAGVGPGEAAAKSKNESHPEENIPAANWKGFFK